VSSAASPWLVRGVSAALTLQLSAAAAALAGPWSWADVPSPPPAPVAAAEVAPPPAVSDSARVAPADPAAPVVLSAPGLWAGAVSLGRLGVDAAGALEVPATAQEAGWWEDGPRPGEPGAAVVVGHVDLDGQPGIFSGLARARAGALIVVGAGAETVRFRVVSVERFPKKAFPSDVVYRPTAEAELRLITCGGRFDRSTGHYEDNVVVRAVRA
jgi:hypothetical protein